MHHITVPRTARYFTLGTVHSALREIWFVCHGYGQLARPFLRNFVPLEAPERLLVAPEALSRFYLEGFSGRVGATWMTREDRCSEIEDHIRYMDALSGQIAGELRPAALRTVVLGFSQGVATVCRWLAQSEFQADHVILWGGHLPPDIGLQEFGARLRYGKLSLVVGNRDEYISARKMDEHEAHLRMSGIHCQRFSFKGGHRLDAALLKQLAENTA